MSGTNKKLNPESNDFESISFHPENAELLKTLKIFSQLLLACGIKVPVSSPASLKALSEMTVDKKRDIQMSFQTMIDFCQPLLTASEGSPFQVSHETEKTCLKNVLDYHNLEVSDEFWKTIDNDQIIEIYGEDMKQIYRGLNFYKYTSYSLLDVSVFEWFVLWDRPKMIIQMMMDQSSQIMQNNLKCFKFQVPRHVVRETKDTGLSTDFVPSASLVDFQYGGVAKGLKSPFKKGLICTSLGEMIAQGDEALRINFV